MKKLKASFSNIPAVNAFLTYCGLALGRIMRAKIKPRYNPETGALEYVCVFKIGKKLKNKGDAEKNAPEEVSSDV